MSDLPIAVVSISGGKDSLATALLAIEQYGHERVRLVHAWTGHESRITDEYVRDYLPRALNLPIEIVQADFTREIASKRMFIARDVRRQRDQRGRRKRWSNAAKRRALAVLHPTGNPYLDLCLWKGRFPSRKAAFCTQELKSRPLDKWFADAWLAGLRPLESWQGVRRDESLNRRDALEYEPPVLDRPWAVRRPIATWTAEDAFAIARRHGIKPNPLYLRNLRRVGCWPCINCGKDELLAIHHAFPEDLERPKEWERLVALASKRGAASFFVDEAYSGRAGTQATIDDRVRWAMTSRGGRQIDLERTIPPVGCSSQYGLCE